MPSAMSKPKMHRSSSECLLGEVAKALGISRQTAWAWAIRGDLPATMLGGRFVVQRRVLNRLVAARHGSRRRAIPGSRQKQSPRHA
jgi:excisionase family DNA binding protein